jgi:hypothetical protein
MIRALASGLIVCLPPRVAVRVPVPPARSSRACCRREISASIAAINSDVFIGISVYANVPEHERFGDDHRVTHSTSPTEKKG